MSPVFAHSVFDLYYWVWGVQLKAYAYPYPLTRTWWSPGRYTIELLPMLQEVEGLGWPVGIPSGMMGTLVGEVGLYLLARTASDPSQLASEVLAVVDVQLFSGMEGRRFHFLLLVRRS